MRVGVIGLSFALRPRREPNPCNITLAHEFDRVVKLEQVEGNQVLGSVQVQLVQALSQRTIRETLVWIASNHRDGASYLDSGEVILQSKEAFDARGGVDEVVIVANPFIHLYGAKVLARKYGLKVREREICKIGFDKESSQWWTRGQARAVIYAAGRVPLKILFGR